MKKTKLVMVGNGMAGVRTLEELIRIAPDLCDITVFGAEPHPNYTRKLLSRVLACEQTLDEIEACPRHNWTIGLDDGCARLPDEGCTPRFGVKLDSGMVHLDLEELNSVALREVSSAG